MSSFKEELVDCLANKGGHATHPALPSLFKGKLLKRFILVPPNIKGMALLHYAFDRGYG